MALTEKYNKVLDLAKSLPIEGLGVTEKDGKLYIAGTAPYQLEKDLVWDEIKAQPDWEKEVSCDLKVTNTDVHGYWVVRPGDSLSKIAKNCYDDAKQYMRIFEANKDFLKNPDVIHPGQKLKIPTR